MEREERMKKKHSLCDTFVRTEERKINKKQITNIRHGERFCPTNHHCRDASTYLMIVSEETVENMRKATIP